MLRITIFEALNDLLHGLARTPSWRTPLSRPAPLVLATVILALVSTPWTAVLIVLLTQVALVLILSGGRRLKAALMRRQISALLREAEGTATAETSTSWSQWNVPARTRQSIDAVRLAAPAAEIVIGRVDREGKVLGLFGPLPGLPATTASGFVPRSRYRLDIVLRGDRVLARKDFRGDRIRFLAEWRTLVFLGGRVNVPALYRVDERRCRIYRDLILGKTVRDILAERGAQIPDARTTGDPDLAALRGRARKRLIEARTAARVPATLSPEFIREVERQIDTIHALGVTGVSHTFQNIIVDGTSGAPWFVDCENGRLSRSTSGLLFRLARDYERMRFQERYRPAPAAPTAQPQASEVI